MPKMYCAAMVFEVPDDAVVTDRLRRLVWTASNIAVDGMMPGTEQSFVIEMMDEKDRSRVSGTLALWSRDRFGDLGATAAIDAATKEIEAARVAKAAGAGDEQE